MRKTDLMKGFLIRPIMEILKKEYDIKSPTPNNLFVNLVGNDWFVYYRTNRVDIDFMSYKLVVELIDEIKNKPEYEKVWL
jgi:hypothetical protein